MKKILLLIVLGGILMVGLTGCGNSVKSVSNVKNDINQVIDDYYTECEKNGEQASLTVYKLQDRLKTYSNYQLLDIAESEFITKPNNPNNSITDWDRSNQVQTYNSTMERYGLIYDSDTATYYSVHFDYDEHTIVKEVTELK